MDKKFAEKYDRIKKRYKPVIPYSEKLNEEEEKLNELLKKIIKEADSLYSVNDPYGIIEWKDDEDIHPKLYDFCYRLPKGGDLHAHDNTMIPLDKFTDIIIEYAMISLSGNTKGNLYTVFSADLPADAIKISEAIEKGILSREDLMDMLVISDDKEENGYWHRLEQLFSATGDFYNDIYIMEKIWEEGFRSCCEKGIILVEVRDWGSEDDLLNIIRDNTIREAYYRVRREYPDFLVRLIGCSGKDSENSVESSCETLRSMIRVSRIVKDEFDPEDPQDFIIGLDLGNEEDNSRPLNLYAQFLMSEEVRNSSLKLYLHCGESLRRENDSVVDAYIMDSYRVGHAMNLYRFPDLMKEYAKRKTSIEVCLMSNYRLGYVRDLRMHPALQYMISGIPISLCSDDGLFMTRAPMVDDFYSAIVCWDLDLGDIKALCRNSIIYSGLSDKEISRLMDAWQRQWNSFVSMQIKALES